MLYRVRGTARHPLPLEFEPRALHISSRDVRTPGCPDFRTPEPGANFSSHHTEILTRMPEFDRRTLGSISDEELLALELDEDLPIDDWMAVEKERSRREERRRRSAARGNATPVDNPAVSRPRGEVHEDDRIREALNQLRALLVPGEMIDAYAVQRRLFALTHRRVVVCATSGRFISLSRGVFGGYVPYDIRWQDLDDASISAGIFGASLTLTSLASDDLASSGNAGRTVRIEGLRKEQAQQVYTLCQAQEQAWREKRRVRDLDELRAQSGGVNLSGALSGAAANLVAAGGDPTERLRQAKQMLDDGLITDAEYETIKARVVDGL
jgi:Short C-terminal domain